MKPRRTFNSSSRSLIVLVVLAEQLVQVAGGRMQVRLMQVGVGHDADQLELLEEGEEEAEETRREQPLGRRGRYVGGVILR